MEEGGTLVFQPAGAHRWMISNNLKMKDMNRDRWKKLMYGLTAALLLSACSQDEPGENSTALPEGEYPLQIGSVTLTAEVSEQPWTRVSENPTDGMSSVWKDGDRIGVRIGDNEETGIYVMNVDAEGRVVGVTPEKAVYWKDKQPATITAWYPLNEELDFTHQNNGLTYLLKGTSTSNANYNTSANLTFSHRLAKVRVKLKGTKADEVTAVTVRSYPKATHNQGTYVAKEGNAAYYPMREANYGGQTYWEANLLDGHLEAANTFRVSSDGKNFVQAKLTTDVDITPGYVHTININVGEAQQVTGNISDDNTYIVSGTREESVNITGGNPTIYLKDANINVSDGPAINITNGNPTIHVFGESNTVSSDNGAGIYVAEGCTVTIQGSSRKDDVLKATAGGDGAGIGSSGADDTSTLSCGNIVIKNVTVYAYSDMSMECTPGIGSLENCGSITIDNSTVYAYGVAQHLYYTPAIGSCQSLPSITISNSEIFAYRGSYNYISTADWIGCGGSSYQGNSIQGTITKTIVHKNAYNRPGYPPQEITGESQTFE